MTASGLPVSLCPEDALIMRARVPFRARGDYQLFDILDYHDCFCRALDPRWKAYSPMVKRNFLAYRGLHWREIPQ